MPDYRRYYVEGGAYFFTVVTHQRRSFLAEELARTCLREAIGKIRVGCPFEMPAVVLLPDHLHAIWTLPAFDQDDSRRWRRIKEEFTRSYLRAGGSEGRRSVSRRCRKERGVWQRRFWEHTLRDEHDFQRHFDYIHYNPVKHGLVTASRHWPYSSFHRWVAEGVYEADWGLLSNGSLAFDDLDQTATEPA